MNETKLMALLLSLVEVMTTTDVQNKTGMKGPQNNNTYDTANCCFCYIKSYIWCYHLFTVTSKPLPALLYKNFTINQQ